MEHTLPFFQQMRWHFIYNVKYFTGISSDLLDGTEPLIKNIKKIIAYENIKAKNLNSGKWIEGDSQK